MSASARPQYILAPVQEDLRERMVFVGGPPRTGVPRFYQVHMGEADYERGPARVLPFHTFCREAGLV